MAPRNGVPWAAKGNVGNGRVKCQDESTPTLAREDRHVTKGDFAIRRLDEVLEAQGIKSPGGQTLVNQAALWPLFNISLRSLL